MRIARPTFARTLLKAASVGALASAALAQPIYDFTLVNSFNANPLAGEAYLWDINDSGTACGVATVDNVIGYPGFVWNEATGNVRVPVASPRNVNSNGLVVGIGAIYDLTNGQSNSPPILPGTYYSPSFGEINDAGVAVGTISTCSCSDSGGVLQIPYIWDEVNGARSLAIANARGLSRINNSGVAIGWLNGWVLNDGFFVDLETGAYTLMNDVFPADFGFGPTRAFDINDNGAIVGTRYGNFPVTWYGYVYSPATGLQILPFPGAGYQQSVRPLGINNAGTIVGDIFTTLGSSRAFVYTAADGIRPLNDAALVAGIPAGYTMTTAQKINNSGWIVGNGTTSGGKPTAFVLKPRLIPGDTDGDGDVDLSDLGVVLAAYGTCSGNPGFSAAADFDQSGCIDLSDLGVVLANFGA